MITEDSERLFNFARITMNAQLLYDRYKDTDMFLEYTIGTHYEYEGLGSDGKKLYLTVTAIGNTFYPVETLRTLVQKANSAYLTIGGKSSGECELIQMGVRPVEYPDNVISMAAYKK